MSRPTLAWGLINGSGLAFGSGLGEAVVTANVLGKSATSRLTVTPAALVSIALSPLNPTVVKAKWQTFRATGTYFRIAAQDITPGDVERDRHRAGHRSCLHQQPRTGAGHGGGPNHPRRLADGQEREHDDHGHRSHASQLGHHAGEPPIVDGGSLQFNATGTYSDGSTGDLTSMVSWTSTDIAPAVNVAAINGSGLATSKSLGRSTITASLLGKSATTTLTIKSDDAFCSADKWCWRNPAPQDQHLFGNWGSRRTTSGPSASAAPSCAGMAHPGIDRTRLPPPTCAESGATMPPRLGGRYRRHHPVLEWHVIGSPRPRQPPKI